MSNIALMKNIGSHFSEYYQKGKYLGSINSNGELADDQIGYVNRRYVTNGEVKLKRKYIATQDNPIMIVSYNMQGR